MCQVLTSLQMRQYLILTEPGEEERHIAVEKAVSEKVKLLGEGEI